MMTESLAKATDRTRKKQNGNHPRLRSLIYDYAISGFIHT